MKAVFNLFVFGTIPPNVSVVGVGRNTGKRKGSEEQVGGFVTCDIITDVETIGHQLFLRSLCRTIAYNTLSEPPGVGTSEACPSRRTVAAPPAGSCQVSGETSDPNKFDKLTTL